METPSWTEYIQQPYVKDKQMAKALFVTNENNEIVGIKRMYDIALALNDSLMQWGAPGVGKSQAVQQWNAEKVRVVEKTTYSGVWA